MGSVPIHFHSIHFRDVGYEPVLIGGLEMGKHLMPGTGLAGERSAEEIRKIAAGLN